MRCNRNRKFLEKKYSPSAVSVPAVRILRFRSVVIGAVLLAGCMSATALAAPPPRAPGLSRGPDATMHGDAEASDTVGVRGPGRGTSGTSYRPLASDCPTVLVGDGGLVQLVCVDIPTKTPSAYLVDPSTGLTMASMRLTKSGLLGGIYSYLDQRDRLVVADGSNSILVIAHRRTAGGTWQLAVARRYPLTRAVPTSDSVVGLTPAWDGRIWFASARGVIGTVNPKTGRVRSMHLPRGEQIANSIASAPRGIAVASTHALYLYRSARSGAIDRVWRRGYDRGSWRKPGQLSWGTGATPTFFGPRTGSEYLTITDNADRMEHLLVYSARTGALVCRTPVVRGTENSPIGFGRSVYVASTYGYPYPAYPAGAGNSHPASAPIAGGMVRVDVRRTGHGCAVTWRNRVHSSSVPRLSRADGLIYTTMRTGNESDADRYDFVAISARTGKVLHRTMLGTGEQFDPIQQAAAIDRHRRYIQGVLTGFLSIATS